MSWRSLLISKPARLSVAQSRLVVKQQEKSTIPLADISAIVLDNPAINLTHEVLTACGEQGIALFATNSQHLPCAICLPYLAHYRISQVYAIQTSTTLPLRKQLWEIMVKAKIRNQAACLKLFNKQHQHLLDLAARVTSGDPGNIEAQAAAWYFVELFGKDFTRKQTDFINSALNYGYAIFRGAIARHIVAHGLHPPLGIHHNSIANAFNLADDLIEVFRPMVDAWVFGLDTTADSLSVTHKAELVDLLNYAWQTPDGLTDSLHAIEQTTESLVRSMATKQPKLLVMPQLIRLGKPTRALRA